MKNLVMMGFKKSGKTTLGRMLASFLGLKFYDTDTLVCELYEKKSVSMLQASKASSFSIYPFLITPFQIVQEKGMEFFRDLESEVIENLNQVKNALISTGGGSFDREKNRNFLQSSSLSIFLQTSPEVCKQRILQDKSSYFSFLSEREFADLFIKRDSVYRSIADITVDTSNTSPEKSSKQILTILEKKYGIQ